jgi:hypothetical protein
MTEEFHESGTLRAADTREGDRTGRALPEGEHEMPAHLRCKRFYKP